MAQIDTRKTGHIGVAGRGLAGLPDGIGADSMDPSIAVTAQDIGIAAPDAPGPLTQTPDSWRNAASGTWGTAANWTAGVPTSSSDATIGVAGAYTVTIAAAAAVNSLTVNDAQAKILDNSTLSVGTTLAVTAGTFTLGSGASIVGGTLIDRGVRESSCWAAAARSAG